MNIRTVEFRNRDAARKRTVVMVDEYHVEHVVEWYMAFHAGDRVAIYVDGVRR